MLTKMMLSLLSVGWIFMDAASRLSCNSTTTTRRNKGPTASNCAVGNLSRPLAQHEDEAGKQDRNRHMIAVGIGRAMLMAVIGTAYADG
jgi:hypothetical protein